MSGPFTSMILGDLGAAIIDIEEPRNGDSADMFHRTFMKGKVFIMSALTAVNYHRPCRWL
jgi:crotonobetainyl-CoA:carnitine CoA-transferase CaiB-like acyl-CoA transferase